MGNQPADFSFDNWEEMRRYAHAVAFSVSHNYHLALDCAQESCQRGYACRLTPPLPKPKSYFRSLAQHVAVRIAQQEAAHATAPLTAEPADESRGSKADAARALIVAIFERLRPKDRDILQRRFLESQGNHEVADEQGLTGPGASMRKTRALARAREVALRLLSGENGA